jgi:hypothetical protein
LDSITNTPKLLKEREGFYQCVDLRGIGEEENRRDSVSTVSTLESEEEVEDEKTWTPESSPGRDKREVEIMGRGSEKKSVELERVRTFGTPPKKMEVEMAAPRENWRLQIPEKGYVPGRNSVGVAF